MENDVVIGQEVPNGTTVDIVIEPGAIILGKEEARLIVTDKAIISADGSESNPIIFDSLGVYQNDMNPYNPDNEQSDTWGGLVIVGNAPVYDYTFGGDYAQVTTTSTSGIVFGGNQADYSNAHDNGSLSYVHIMNAGSSPSHLDKVKLH